MQLHKENTRSLIASSAKYKMKGWTGCSSCGQLENTTRSYDPV